MTPLQELFQQAVQAQRAGHKEQAVTLYRQVLQRSPNHVDALHLLGVLCTQLGNLTEAVNLIEQAITQNPKAPYFYNSLGNALRAQERLPEAALNYQQATRLKPDYAEAYGNLAIVQKRLALLDEAIASYEKALAINPQIYAAHYNLGNAYGEKKEIAKAITAYRQAVALKPDYADAQLNLAHALLLSGQYAEGWEAYEWRFAERVPVRDFQKPRWEGTPFPGKTLLVQWEQGFGDTFQFVRFLPQLAALGGRVIFECQPGMARVLQGCSAITSLVEGTATGEAPAVPFDLSISLMSLPRLLKTTLDTLPNSVPYLQPDPQLVAEWKERLGETAGRKIGIVWASNPHVEDRLGRSCPLHAFYALASVPNVSWFSLQKGVALNDPAFPSVAEMPIRHLGPALDDFADTAAVIANLDLIITVDTSVAHLAGALGKPVWTVLTAVPNWRWLLEREDTPWYPTMRLFRQETAGNWCPVFAAVRAQLLAEG